jgi:outer membrane protein, multidrug efflux system
MYKQTFIAITALFLVEACTMEPVYVRPTAPVSQTYPSGGVYGAQSGASAPKGSDVPAADIGWRDFFSDPRLQGLVEIALKNNRDLRVSMLNVEAARAQYRISRSQLLPTLDATGSGVRQRVPQDLATFPENPYSVYSVGLSASWEIDFWGRIRSLKDQALAEYFATAQARKAAEISLVSQVADQYLTILADDDLLEVTRHTLETAQVSYNITKAQFDQGTGTELDLRQAETVVAAAQANLQAQERARAQDENALVLLIGEPIPSDLPPGLPLDSQNLLADIPAGVPSDLLTRRPDIMEAEQALLAANANIGAARAAFFPRISLTGTFGSESLSLGSLFKAGTAAWSFAPQVAMPIFEGGSNLANLDLAHVEKNIQIAQYEKAIQSAFREVADGLAARGTYDQQIDALTRDSFANQRRLDLADLRYQNGVDNYLTVLAAQTDLYSSQQALVSARLARLVNLVGLYRSLGGGWVAQSNDRPRAADAAAG